MSKGHEFIACCPNYWGSGATLGEAVRNMLRVGGTRENCVVKKIPSYAENPWVDDFGQFRADIKEGCEKPETEESWEEVFNSEETPADDLVLKYGRLTIAEMEEVIDPLKRLLERTDNPELVKDVLMMFADWAIGFNLLARDGYVDRSNRNPLPAQAKVSYAVLAAAESVDRLKFDEADSE
tara:strand:+ start:2736 stop:3278 length:543 start_codon:yes stop_codon:yes gene_type:complete